ncbi:MAG: hypothetical protein FD169_1076 [Bacillota bacterium]|nr:MAG: hypothetical protein FD169_1076 [Bacillota bacterium]
MTAIVLTFHNRISFEQASCEINRRGLQCHAFPLGLLREKSASFYRRWLLKNLPSVTPASSLMVVPLFCEAKSSAPDLICDLALSLTEPESVTAYLIGDNE